DALAVVDGPLKNHEGMITRVVRKKCLAIVEIHAGSVRIVTKVGLALMPEQEAIEAAQLRNSFGSVFDAPTVQPTSNNSVDQLQTEIEDVD
ncbi:MAG: hypothetical protein Q4C09_10410, partial [Atopobiaceae bacterium]|nr:hypothetical protein [Atopobiaceae bacterium]